MNPMCDIAHPLPKNPFMDRVWIMLAIIEGFWECNGRDQLRARFEALDESVLTVDSVRT